MLNKNGVLASYYMEVEGIELRIISRKSGLVKLTDSLDNMVVRFESKQLVEQIDNTQ